MFHCVVPSRRLFLTLAATLAFLCGMTVVQGQPPSPSAGEPRFRVPSEGDTGVSTDTSWPSRAEIPPPTQPSSDLKSPATAAPLETDSAVPGDARFQTLPLPGRDSAMPNPSRSTQPPTSSPQNDREAMPPPSAAYPVPPLPNGVDAAAPPKPPAVPHSNGAAKPTRAKPEQLLRGLEDPNHPLAGLLAKPAGTETIIDGVSLPLADLLKNNRAPSARKPLLDAYWKLAGALIECRLLDQREQQFRAWTKQYQASDTTNEYIKTQLDLLTAAADLATAERGACECDFVKHQYELVALRNPGVFVGSITKIELPIPSDYPLATTYRTRIDEMRGVSNKARLLDRLLTLQLSEIRNTLAAQQAASTYLNVLLAQKSPRMQEVLSAYDRWHQTRLAVVQAIIDYNLKIADFAAETVGAEQSLENLLGAHIKLAPAEGLIPPASPTSTSSVP